MKMMVVYPNLLLLLCASLSTATIWILVGPVLMTAVVGRHRHQGSTRQLVTISDSKSEQGWTSGVVTALQCLCSARARRTVVARVRSSPQAMTVTAGPRREVRRGSATPATRASPHSLVNDHARVQTTRRSQWPGSPEVSHL